MTQGRYTAYAAQHYRSIFLSDFHMGARSFDAAALVDFLKSVDCDYLFLIGDIIDGWKLNKRWYWTEECNEVIDELVRKTQEGTNIIYLPGNHDDEIRRTLPFTRRRFARKLGITIKDRIIHTLGDGRQFLILHGDQFDHKILRGPLPKWSDRLYEFAMDALRLITPRALPTITIKGEKKPFSLAKALKKHGKIALYLIGNLEKAVYKAAQEKEVDGLICGHTHIPIIKTLKDITYANPGSWVSTHHTALVEQENGTLEILDWPESTRQQPEISPILKQPAVSCKIVADSSAYRPQTETIVRRIRQIWPVLTKSSKAAAQLSLPPPQNRSIVARFSNQ